MKTIVTVPLLLLHTAALPSLARAQTERAVEVRNDSISVRFIDADLRLVVQAMARYMDKPVMFGALGEHRVTLETPAPVPIASIPGVLQGMVTMYGLELTEDDDFYSIRPAIGTLPDPGVALPLQLYVIKLRHARAADVAATVSALYGVASALGEPGAPPRTLAESLNDNLIPPAGTDTSAARRPIIGLTAEFSGDVRITPDARTNSLLVRASSRDFELVRAAAELDVRPLQVLIEVTIAEIRRDRSLGFGADAVLPGARIRGTTDTEVSGELIGGGLGDFVLKVMDIGGSDLAVVLRAAASRGDVTILSRPVVSGKPRGLESRFYRPYRS